MIGSKDGSSASHLMKPMPDTTVVETAFLLNDQFHGFCGSTVHSLAIVNPS